jgi:hypothetical protein
LAFEAIPLFWSRQLLSPAFHLCRAQDLQKSSARYQAMPDEYRQILTFILFTPVPRLHNHIPQFLISRASDQDRARLLHVESAGRVLDGALDELFELVV